jgi:hypothetical protein
MCFSIHTFFLKKNCYDTQKKPEFFFGQQKIIKIFLHFSLTITAEKSLNEFHVTFISFHGVIWAYRFGCEVFGGILKISQSTAAA